MFSPSIVFSFVDQSGSGEMIRVHPIPCVAMEKGHRVNLIHGCAKKLGVGGEIAG